MKLLSITLCFLATLPITSVRAQSLDAELTQSVLLFSLPHVGIARSWGRQTDVVVLEECLESDLLLFTEPLTPDAKQSIRNSLLRSETGVGVKAKKELLEELTPKQRADVEQLILLIDGLSSLSRTWWITELDLTQIQVDEIEKLRKHVSKEMVGPLNASVFVRKQTPGLKCKFGVYSFQANVSFGLKALKLLTEKQKRILQEKFAPNSSLLERRARLLETRFTFEAGFHDESR